MTTMSDGASKRPPGASVVDRTTSSSEAADPERLSSHSEKDSRSHGSDPLKLDATGLPLVPQPSRFRDDPLVSRDSPVHRAGETEGRASCNSPTALSLRPETSIQPPASRLSAQQHAVRNEGASRSKLTTGQNRTGPRGSSGQCWSRSASWPSWAPTTRP
jgi:hypothetical protein